MSVGFLRNHRRRPKPIMIMSTPPHRLCWWCSKELDTSFTSVTKLGQGLHVHFGCRVDAQARIDGQAPVDYEQLPA